MVIYWIRIQNGTISIEEGVNHYDETNFKADWRVILRGLKVFSYNFFFKS